MLEHLHAAWSSLTYGKIKGEEILIWGGTDGYCYGYLNKTQKDEDGYDLFQPKWKVDCNELSYRKDKEGKKIPYATPPGPSELIGTPVLYEDKVYCAIGQDPEHGDGVGRLSCIDASSGRFCGNTPMWDAPYPRHQFMKGWFILLSMRVLSTASMQKRESYIGRMILLVEYGVPL